MSDTRLKSRPDRVLEDPGALAVATLYAKSYLTAAAANSVSAPEEELNSLLDDVIEGRPEFGDLLMSNVISRDDRLGMIDRVVAPASSPYFANFLRVLARHGRLDLLPQIRIVVERMQEEAAGKRRVQVRSARGLSDKSRGQIRDGLKSRLGFDAVLVETVDPKLVGGLVIQVGDTVYDSSLRSRLQQLQGRLVEKALNEIQSRRDRFSHPEGD